jgi:transcriptional regulator with XRE-family HTH domain
MLRLFDVADAIAAKRKTLRLTQAELAKRAGLGLSTLDALENHRLGELGFSRIAKILAVLELELRLAPNASRRPTLDDLRDEGFDAEGLDGRG